MKISVQSCFWVGLVGAVIVLTMASVRFHSGLGGEVEIDEIYWVGSVYYYDLVMIERLPLHPDWQLLPSRENPPVGKYLIGAALMLQGDRITNLDPLASFFLHYAELPGAWGRGSSVAKRQAVVDRMSKESRNARERSEYQPLSDRMLRSGRWLMLVMGLLATAGVMVLGWQIAGPATSTLAGLLFALHPITFMTAVRISVDLIALAFSIAAILALSLLLNAHTCGHEDSRRRELGLPVMLGVCLALACGAKMNATVVLITTLIVWMVLLVLPGRRWKRLALVVSGALAISAVVFVVINPALYPDPMNGLIALIRENAISAGIQAEFIGDGLTSLSDRFRALSVLVCGRRLWLGAALLLLVAMQTVRGLWRGDLALLVVCLWWWVAVLAVGLWLPFAWPRYALPLLPPTALLIASGIISIPQAIVRWLISRAEKRGT